MVALQNMVKDYSHELSRKKWALSLFSDKLLKLRFRKQLTQNDVSKRSGINVSTIRNYEQMKSFPKNDHLVALAKAFDIRPEALRIVDIDPTPANALFQLGETYGLQPSSDPNFAYLTPENSFMESFLHKWAIQYQNLKNEDIDRSWYEDWKDSFEADFNPTDFLSRYTLSQENKYELIEPWVNIQFADNLRRLRKTNNLTQEDLAELIGTTKTTIRSYEQRKRLPKNSQLELLAAGLNVTQGALTFFDFGSPVQAAHAIFQIAHTYGLIPDHLDEKPILRTIQPGLEKIIDQWAEALNGNYENTRFIKVASYQEWKDNYDPQGSVASSWETRYRHHWSPLSNGSQALNGMESDYDPYDERYKAGYLRP